MEKAYIMSLRPILRKGLRWHIGDGASISFRLDNWVYAIPLADLFTDVYKEATLKVSDFISQENQWKTSLLGNFVPPNIVQDIIGMFIPSSNIIDNLVWGLITHGEYSVKSGAKLLQGYGIHFTPKVSFD